MKLTHEEALNQLVEQTREDAEIIYTVARLLARKKPKVSLAQVMAPILQGFSHKPNDDEDALCKVQ